MRFLKRIVPAKLTIKMKKGWTVTEIHQFGATGKSIKLKNNKKVNTSKR